MNGISLTRCLTVKRNQVIYDTITTTNRVNTSRYKQQEVRAIQGCHVTDKYMNKESQSIYRRIDFRYSRMSLLRMPSQHKSFKKENCTWPTFIETGLPVASAVLESARLAHYSNYTSSMTLSFWRKNISSWHKQ